ncbi:MAG: DUF1801 domain-containing protein [Pseudomonadota bacterium]
MTAPATVASYLDSLPEAQADTVRAIRDVVTRNLQPGFEEGLQYGMLGYYVPHSLYPPGYHANPKEPLPLASIGAQKRHIGLYLFCVYMHDDTRAWFVDAWRRTGMRLDMGKACFRVRSLDETPLELLGELFRAIDVQQFIDFYEGARRTRDTTDSGKTPKKGRKATKRRPATRKPKG